MRTKAVGLVVLGESFPDGNSRGDGNAFRRGFFCESGRWDAYSAPSAPSPFSTNVSKQKRELLLQTFVTVSATLKI